MADRTSAQLYELIRKKYPAPAWAVLPQVADGTGARAKRWADAVAMSLYPSRGLELHGFEIKVARGDWLKELASPDKAEAVAAFCDRWWVVAPPQVAKLDELPPLWGLLEVRGDSLTILKAAEALTAKPVDRVFLASLFRRVYEHGTSAAEIDMAHTKGVEEERARHIERVRTQIDTHQEQVQALAKELGALRVALGTSNTEFVGQAVKLLMTFQGPHYRRNALDQLKSVAQEVVSAVTELDKFVNEVLGHEAVGGGE